MNKKSKIFYTIIFYFIFLQISYSKGKITMYIYDFNASSKFPITEKTIMHDYTIKNKVSNNLFKDLDQLLLNSKINTSDSIYPNKQVRLVATSRENKLIVYKDLTFLYNNKIYLENVQIFKIIKSYLSKPKLYVLPIWIR